MYIWRGSRRFFTIYNQQLKGCKLFNDPNISQMRHEMLCRNQRISRYYHSQMFKQFYHGRRIFSLPLVGSGILCGIYSLYLKFGLDTVIAADMDDGNGKKLNSQMFNIIADVVEVAAPSVVNIENKGRHPFRRNHVITESNGSGFIVREDGLILTNAHVVANKDVVSVKLQDGRQFSGKVQAVDQITDLATVKINAKNLPALKLGKSSSVRPGEFVIAMGSPLALSNTVTFGIVSSVKRGSSELGMHNRDISYIQTDAVINFGNSGGPLVNLDGEAIGINTMKVTTGISFAIPSDVATDFLERAEKLMKIKESKGWFGTSKNEVKKRRYVGITLLTLTPDIIAELRSRGVDLPDNIQGCVLVNGIIVGSPAHTAGLQAGDLIVKINGGGIKSASEVFKAIETSDVMNIDVIRRDRMYNITVVPEDVD